jgi:hypothetical protein
MKNDKCSICKNEKGKRTNQYCRDNPKHPTYEERYDCWDGLTYLDCWGFIRLNETEKEYEERVFQKNSTILYLK